MGNKTKSAEPSAEALRLEKISWDNYEAVTRLHVNKEQRDYVASNRDSLIHACVCMVSEGKPVQNRLLPLGCIEKEGSL